MKITLQVDGFLVALALLAVLVGLLLVRRQAPGGPPEPEQLQTAWPPQKTIKSQPAPKVG